MRDCTGLRLQLRGRPPIRLQGPGGYRYLVLWRDSRAKAGWLYPDGAMQGPAGQLAGDRQSRRRRMRADLLAGHPALVSFTYNIGGQAFCSSTLVRKLNAGDTVGACNELSRWTRAKGIELPGLVKRRAAERAMCLQGLT